MHERERITLVYADPAHTDRNWDSSKREASIITVSNYNLLNAALQAGVRELGRDIDRVIFDRSVDGDTFLAFLSSLPIEFRGDVIRIRNDGSGTLSASSPRGDGRFLYGLSEHDVTFYLTAVTRVGFRTLDAVSELTVQLPEEDPIPALRLAPAMAG